MALAPVQGGGAVRGEVVVTIRNERLAWLALVDALHGRTSAKKVGCCCPSREGAAVASRVKPQKPWVTPDSLARGRRRSPQTHGYAPQPATQTRSTGTILTHGRTASNPSHIHI